MADATYIKYVLVGDQTYTIFDPDARDQLANLPSKLEVNSSATASATLSKITSGTITYAVPTISITDDTTPSTPTTTTVNVLQSISANGHMITEDKVVVPTQQYIDDLVGNINSLLDELNNEVI